jgi:CRP-like cAMP-binding protein/CheY-like chemotaxis protein
MKKILLIEDNLEVRENTAELLSLSNYEVTTAENGKIGVEKARQVKPDLIICDIMMPEMDGHGVLYSLSRNPETAPIPFIFLSAKAERSDIRKGMSMGADDYITKPFDDIELLEAVESRLKKSEFLNKSFQHNAEGYSSFINEVKGFEDLKKLAGEATVREFEKGQTIFSKKQYPRHLFLVNSGRVKTYKASEDGKEYISAIYKSGDYFGYQALLEDKAYIESAEALESTELCLIPKDDFLKLLHSNRQVALCFIKMLSNNLVETEQKLLDMAYNSVRKRVAQSLIYLNEKYPAEETNGKPSFAFSREGLASLAGTATESAIRALSDFKDEGLISVSGKNIILLNKDRLERMRN